MQIFVKTVRGNTITIDTQPTDTINDLKEKIYQKVKIKPNDQRLIYSGKQLEDSYTIQEQKVPKNSTLHLLLRLPGDYESIYYVQNLAIVGVLVD